MANSIYDVLFERGYIAQVTQEDDIRALLNGGAPVTFYVGFDPTADSLHIGHFIPLMVMAHLQRAGHRPIALIGGGTTMVGDPSGRTDMRNMMTPEQIRANAERFKVQISRFLSFDGDGGAIMVDNADWLLKLNYLEFLRDVGAHFSVNRMLTAECYKQRLEKGLSFIEFNYMLMQSYDFLELNRRFGCLMQVGGDDQWSNIISGVDLVRRKESKEVFGMTLSLLTTSEGTKMGKTQKGALWIDAAKTAPFEFYQYWRNVHDADVINCLKLLTFLPMEEIIEFEKLEGAELNAAKKALAYEVTKLIHGQEEAEKSAELAAALFEAGSNIDNLASTNVGAELLEGQGIGIVELLVLCGLSPSKGEARRLVVQGGIAVNSTRVDTIERKITADDFADGILILQKGKKTYHKVLMGCGRQPNLEV